MTEQERMTKLEGAKTLIARARRRTIGSVSYRGNMNLALETTRDLSVAEELLEQIIDDCTKINKEGESI